MTLLVEVLGYYSGKKLQDKLTRYWLWRVEGGGWRVEGRVVRSHLPGAG